MRKIRKPAPDVERDVGLPIEAAELRVEDRYRLRAHETDAADEIRIPLKDLLPDFELSVEGHVREVCPKAELPIVDRHARA